MTEHTIVYHDSLHRVPYAQMQSKEGISIFMLSVDQSHHHMQTCYLWELWPSARLARRGRIDERDCWLLRNMRMVLAVVTIYFSSKNVQHHHWLAEGAVQSAGISRTWNPCHVCNKGPLPDRADNARSLPGISIPTLRPSKLVTTLRWG